MFVIICLFFVCDLFVTCCYLSDVVASLVFHFRSFVVCFSDVVVLLVVVVVVVAAVVVVLYFLLMWLFFCGCYLLSFVIVCY